MSGLDRNEKKIRDYAIRGTRYKLFAYAAKDKPTEKVKEYFRRKPYEPCKKTNADGEEKGNDNN